MNPFREAGDVDQTEIAKARLHEEAETQRARFRETEETRRQRIKQHGDAWIFPWVVGGVMSFTIVVAGAVLTNTWLEARTPRHCQETVEPFNGLSKKCAPGSVMTMEKMSDGVDAVRCTCPKEERK